MKVGLHAADIPKKRGIKKRTLFGILVTIIVFLWGLVAAGRAAGDSRNTR